MKKLLLLLTALFLSFAPASEVYAQNADRKYEEGMAQYKKRNWEVAKKLFKESMILDKSAANTNRCNKMIKRINAIIAGPRPGPKPPKPDLKPESKAELSINRNQLSFSGRASEVYRIKVTSSNGWSFRYDNQEDEQWCLLHMSEDGKELTVRADPSNLTISRHAKIMICDLATPSVYKELYVTQSSGKVPSLIANPANVNRIDYDGSEELITVTCVSDTVYSDGKNWILKDYPSWVTILNDKPVRQNWVEKASNAISSVVKKNVIIPRTPIEANELSVKFLPNTIREVRTGYIVLQSQNVEMRIELQQKASKRKKK